MNEMKQRINLSITILFTLLIFGFGIAFWIVPDKDFSEEENRVLQELPSVSLEGWLDGSVSAQMTAYYSDQFPLRNLWVNLHAAGELARGYGESGGVLLGQGGQLATRRFDMYVSRTERAVDTDFYLFDHVQKGLDALVALDQTLSEEGVELCVVLAPRTIDVTAGDFAYPSILSDRLDADIRTGLAEINSVELLDTFRTMHEAGEYVYFRTDHHWTSLGAYTAYAAVMQSLGMEDAVLPTDFFTVRSVPNFYGTAHARAGMAFLPPDVLDIWHARDGSDDRHIVRDEKGHTVIEAGFISESHLATRDKYGAFLDGTHRLLTITDQEAEAVGATRPRLLLARDSFANSMVPFLARHFDIVMVNLSGGMTDLSELAAAYGCSHVLVVCNRENLITSDCVTLVH